MEQIVSRVPDLTRVPLAEAGVYRGLMARIVPADSRRVPVAAFNSSV